MEWIGDLERSFAEAIYPNRVLVGVVAFAIVALVVLVAWSRRWDRLARRHPGASAAAAIALLAVAVPVGWYLGSPLFITKTVDEPVPVAQGATSPSPQTAPGATAPAASPTAAVALRERRGTFRGADEFHFGRGTARLIETAPGVFTLRLENFAVRNGPDLFVYLSPSPTGYADGAIELAPLKADRGNQNYAVKPGTNVAAARSVVIWCKQFAVLFATAPLSTI